MRRPCPSTEDLSVIEPPQPPADELDWVPVLDWLPTFASGDVEAGHWTGGEQLGPQLYTMRYAALSEDVTAFVDCLYQQQVVAGSLCLTSA
jgi:hypothetical protein